MVNLLSIPKNQRGYYALAVLMAIFIILPIEIPRELAGLIDTNLGKVVIVVIVLNMFLSHHVIGAVGAIAAYELVKRSSEINRRNSSGKSIHKYVPTESQKTGNLNKMNQFPVTVEEIVIKRNIPYSFNITNPTLTTTFRPVNEDTHDAAGTERL